MPGPREVQGDWDHSPPRAARSGGDRGVIPGAWIGRPGLTVQASCRLAAERDHSSARAPVDEVIGCAIMRSSREPCGVRNDKQNPHAPARPSPGNVGVTAPPFRPEARSLPWSAVCERCQTRQVPGGPSVGGVLLFF
jgi:hypothetical protein